MHAVWVIAAPGLGLWEAPEADQFLAMTLALYTRIPRLQYVGCIVGKVL